MEIYPTNNYKLQNSDNFMLLDLRIEKLIIDRFGGQLTEIQKKTFVPISEGRDVLITAPTGKGKTEAAILPLLSKILSLDDKKGIQLVYITPLKALNRDMLDRLEWWCTKLKISKDLRHGDTSQHTRMKQSQNPPQVLITTPETLNGILVNKYLGDALKNTRFVIVDEIHELVTSKRGVQLSMVLERLNKRSLHKVQRIGVSATVGNAIKMAEYLSPQNNVEIIEDVENKDYSIQIIYPKVEDIKTKLNHNLAKKVDLGGDSLSRILNMKELIKEKTLVFVNTRSAAEAISSRLKILGVSVGIHHGSLSKEVRLKAEKDFKNSKIKTLVCTSSMELGIDIGDVELVIQYISPRQTKRLIQRVGRAGHHHTKISNGVIIAIDIEDYIESLAIDKLLKQKWIEEEKILINSYDVIAQQLIGILLEGKQGFHKKLLLGDVHKILSKAYTYKITLETLSEIAEQLADTRMVYIEKSERIENWELNIRTLKARMYFYTHLSTIPSNINFTIRDIQLNRIIGRLDEKFVSVLSKGDKFITKSIPWKVVDITDQEVLVEGVEDYTLSIPDWIGEELPVPYEIAQTAGRLREEIRMKKIKTMFGALAERLEKDIVETPTDKNLIIESTPETIVIHTCAGNKVNETLSKILAHQLSVKYGIAKTNADQYRIFIESSYKIPAKEIEKSLMSIENVNLFLDKIIPETYGFIYEINHVGKLFGAIKNDDRINKKAVWYLKDSPIFKESIESMKFKYYDVEKTSIFLKSLKNKSIFIYDNVELSLWSKLGTVDYRFGDILGKVEPQKEVIEIFIKNIMERKIKFRCTYCSNVWYSELKDLENFIKCPKCNSPMVGVAGVLREGNFYENADPKVEKSAELVRGYGKKAVIALSVYGVGPQTASKILRMMRQDEKQFFMDLIDAQKNFIKNKRFWSI